jgi:hypothetical protein
MKCPRAADALQQYRRETARFVADCVAALRAAGSMSRTSGGNTARLKPGPSADVAATKARDTHEQCQKHQAEDQVRPENTLTTYNCAGQRCGQDDASMAHEADVSTLSASRRRHSPHPLHEQIVSDRHIDEDWGGRAAFC